VNKPGMGTRIREKLRLQAEKAKQTKAKK